MYNHVIISTTNLMASEQQSINKMRFNKSSPTCYLLAIVLNQKESKHIIIQPNRPEITTQVLQMHTCKYHQKIEVLWPGSIK